LKIQQPGEATNPVSVDAQFFCSLKSILEKVRVIGIRSVAATHGLSKESVQWIAQSESGGTAANGAADSAPPDAVDQELQSVDDDRFAKIRLDIGRYMSISYVLSHKGKFGILQLMHPVFTRPGKSFKPENLENLIFLLETEAGYPFSIGIDAGDQSRFSLQVILGGVPRGAIYSISGEEDDCVVVADRVNNMLRASAPQFSWLHRSSGRQFVALACALCVGMAIAAFFSRFAEGLWFPILVGVAALAFFPFRWTMQQAYPVCQFEFGPDKRRRATHKAIVGAALSVIVIPIIKAVVMG
jgi:hypothetical protein